MLIMRQAFIKLLNPETNCIDLTILYKEYADRLHIKLGFEMFEIISNFQESGDTELTAYPTNCSSDICSNMNESKYFTLVGNNSKNYALLKLVSVPNQEIQIRFCSSIKPTPEIELNELNEIWRDPNAPPF